MDDAGAQPRSPVTPSPMSLGRAIVRGGGAVTLGGGIAAVFLLLGTVVVGMVAEELIGSQEIDLLARGAMASLGILVLIGCLGEPLRHALECWLLARDASRLGEGQTPPNAERSQVRAGAHAALMFAGVAGIIVGGIGLPIGLVFATDAREAVVVRILLPTIGGLLLLGGIALTWWSRGRGPGRSRWAERCARLSRRWGRAIGPVPRAHQQRRLRILGWAGGAIGGGGMIFFAGVYLRQPARYVDPVTWNESGERAIDALLAMGALVMGVALAVVLAVHAGLLLWTGLRDGRTVRSLERGDRVLLERVDAVLLDEGPLERLGMAFGVVGWLVVAYGWSPTFIAAIESGEEIVAIRPLSALVGPGLLAVGFGWLLGSFGALRLRSRRARVQAVLLRDPRAAVVDEAALSETDRRANAVRDIALNAPGAIL